jgi:hypothetical protein
MAIDSEAKKELDDGSHDSDENAGAEPGGGGLLGVVVAAQHFDVHMDRTPEADDRRNSVHELGGRGEVTSDQRIGLVDAGVPVGVLGRRGGCGE